MTYNHPWENADRKVGAGLTSLPGSHFTIPVSAPAGDFGLANAGVSLSVAKSVSFSLSYQTTLFYSGERQQNINATMQILL